MPNTSDVEKEKFPHFIASDLDTALKSSPRVAVHSVTQFQPYLTFLSSTFPQIKVNYYPSKANNTWRDFRPFHHPWMLSFQCCPAGSLY